jgi:aminopeptidase N
VWYQPSPSPFAFTLQGVTVLPGQPLAESLLAHHLAYQWFGHSVTHPAAADEWLRHAFVRYAEWLAAEEVDGRAALDERIARIHAELGPTTRPPAIVRSADELRDESALDRGAVALHALRLELGDETFFRVVREYTRRFRHGVATTRDFVVVAESLAGEELDAFFESWLYAEPVPELPQATVSR